MVGREGFEPTTIGLKVLSSFEGNTDIDGQASRFSFSETEGMLVAVELIQTLTCITQANTLGIRVR